MTRDEFIAEVTRQVSTFAKYLNNYDSNPQLRVNPANYHVGLVNGTDMLDEIDNSDENIEIGAAAEDPASEDGAFNQISRNPDFYPLRKLVKDNKPDTEAIAGVADVYFG